MRGSSRWTSRLLAATAVVAVGAITACGASPGGSPGGSPSGDVTPAARVSPDRTVAGSPTEGTAEGTAAVSVPADRQGREAEVGPEGAALAFADFAAGGDGAGVPFADEVSYRIGGADVATLTAREAVRRAAWRACPPAGSTYEGRDCPVSPLASLAGLDREGAPVQVEPGWPASVGCTGVEPADLEVGTSAVTLRPPPQRRDCFSDLGVLLRVDAGGRIDLVELVLSGS